MFLPSTIFVTWHNIVITWSVARMKTITLNCVNIVKKLTNSVCKGLTSCNLLTYMLNEESNQTALRCSHDEDVTSSIMKMRQAKIQIRKRIRAG